MTLNIHELRAAAEKATPGPWHSRECNAKLPDGSPCWCRWVAVDGDPEGHRKWIAPTGSLLAENADHIAACSPDRIIALCDFVRDVADYIPDENFKRILARHGITLDAPEGR